MFRDIVNAMATAIQSSPIIYLRHHDYDLIDAVLIEALGGILRRNRPQFKIAEFEEGIGMVGFAKKNDNRVQFQEIEKFLDDLTFSHTLEEKGYEVFLIRNAQDTIAKQPGLLSRLLLFAQQYERKSPVSKTIPFNPCRTIILVDPLGDFSLSSGLEKHVSIIDIPVPEENEIWELVRKTAPTLEDAGIKSMVRILKGLDRSDIMHILSTITTWNDGMITEESFVEALKEKKQIAKKSGVIEVIETNESFKHIGGLDVLRETLSSKAVLFRELNRADRYGVPIPKGVLIIGMPGCGKTMIAKAIANEFATPLFRLDMNRILGSYVGESERNMHKALSAAETASPCVLWIDEIEKAFSGTNNSSGENDDTVMRMMGMFLTWLQEHRAPVFIVATANDEMRSEFMRKGRFDDIFFVDWPNSKELESIFRKQIEWFESHSDFDFSQLFRKSSAGDYLYEDKHRLILEDIIRESAGFTGSEINSAIKLVMERLFVKSIKDHEEGYELTTADLTVTPSDLRSVLIQMQPHRLFLQEQKEEDSTVKRLGKLRNKYTSASNK